MTARRSSIHSNEGSDDDQLITLTAASGKPHEHIALKPIDASLTEDNPDDEDQSDAEILLGEASIEPPQASSQIFTRAPARYVIAAWAFFGFFCLYALRVNLSVAIVAMVRLFIIDLRRNLEDIHF